MRCPHCHRDFEPVTREALQTLGYMHKVERPLFWGCLNREDPELESLLRAGFIARTEAGFVITDAGRCVVEGEAAP